MIFEISTDFSPQEMAREMSGPARRAAVLAATQALATQNPMTDAGVNVPGMVNTIGKAVYKVS